MSHPIRAAAGGSNTSPIGRRGALAAAAWALVLGLSLLSGCQTGSSGTLPVLTHQPTYQPGLVGAIETYPMPDWAIAQRNDAMLNPSPSISPYLEESVVVRQQERLRTVNGRPSEYSHFRTYTWQFRYGFGGWE